MELSQNQLKKFYNAKSVEEIISVGKECGLNISTDQAQAALANNAKFGELSEDELSSVSGGLNVIDFTNITVDYFGDGLLVINSGDMCRFKGN